MTRAQKILETPCSFVRAAQKLAKVRGDYGSGGGWVRNRHGAVVCQGWDVYGNKVGVRSGLLVQDDEHGGGNGKWYVWVLGLSADDLSRAEAVWPPRSV